MQHTASSGPTDLFTGTDTQAVKGVAILLMMWHHLFGFPQYHAYADLLPGHPAYYLGLFGKICVALYLFLSGYGLTRRGIERPGPLGLPTLQRLRKFYASYWFYFGLCTPYGLLVLRDGRFAPDLAVLLRNIAGWINYNNGYDVAWWFVSVYVPLVALFPLFFRLARREPLLLGALMLGALGLHTRLASPDVPGSLLLWQAPFLVGILVAQLDLFQSGLARQAAAKPWWWHALWLAALFLYRFRAGGDCTTDFVIAPLWAFSSACLIRRIGAQRPFVFLGALSLPLWLTHGFVCYSYAERWIYAPRHPIAIFALLLAVIVPLVWVAERFRAWADGIELGRARRTAG